MPALLYYSTKIATWFWGGCDGLMYTLIAFVIVESITAVLRALSDRKHPTLFSLKGISGKFLIFLLVGVGHIVGVYLAGGGNVIRTGTVLFYISCEGKAIFENAEALGVRIPKLLSEFLKRLNQKDNDSNLKSK